MLYPTTVAPVETPSSSVARNPFHPHPHPRPQAGFFQERHRPRSTASGRVGLPLLPRFPPLVSSCGARSETCCEPTWWRGPRFSVHALKDAELPERLARYLSEGKPILVSAGLTERLDGKVKLDAPNVHVLAVKAEPKGLLDWAQSELAPLRASILPTLGSTFEAPNRVGLYLFDDGSWVVENFNDEPVTARANPSRFQPAVGFATGNHAPDTFPVRGLC